MDELKILPDDLSTLEELESWKREFDFLPYNIRKRSNDASISLFGSDNITRYNEKKQALLLMGQKDNNAEEELNPPQDLSTTTSIQSEASSISSGIMMTNDGNLYQSWKDTIAKAKVQEDLGFVLMVLTDTDKRIEEYDSADIAKLDKKWEEWQLMEPDHKSQSDNIALNIFGMNNHNLYAKIKTMHAIDTNKPSQDASDIHDDLQNAIDTVKSESCDLLRNTIRLHLLKEESSNAYIDIETKYAVDKLLQEASKPHEYTSMRDSMLPFFTANEAKALWERTDYDKSMMIGDMKITDWQKSYLENDGLHIQNSYEWYKTLNNLYTEYTIMRESNGFNLAVNPRMGYLRKQIIALGWNPDIGFNYDLTHKVAIRHKIPKPLGFVDVSYMYEATEPLNMDTIQEETELRTQSIMPLYICLFGETSLHSRVIEKYTKSPYSHAAIATNSSLNRTYSFNIITDENGVKHNGFIEEHKNFHTPGAVLGLMVLFVTKEQYHAIVDSLKWLKKNADSTKYSIKNIIRLVLNLAQPKTENLQMICSQFVYTLLQLVNVHLENDKSANLVSPADISKLEDARLFYLYQGKFTDYNYHKVQNMIRQLFAKLPPSLYNADKLTLREAAMKSNMTIEEFKQICASDPKYSDIVNLLTVE